MEFLWENHYETPQWIHVCFDLVQQNTFEERNILPNTIDKNEQMFLCERTNVSSDWPHHLKQPENELMIKIWAKKQNIKRLWGTHLYLKAFYSYHYKKNMIIRLLFLSYSVPYKSSYSANGKSMDLNKKIYCLINFPFYLARFYTAYFF